MEFLLGLRSLNLREDWEAKCKDWKRIEFPIPCKVETRIHLSLSDCRSAPEGKYCMHICMCVFSCAFVYMCALQCFGALQLGWRQSLLEHNREEGSIFPHFERTCRAILSSELVLISFSCNDHWYYCFGA